LEARDAAAARLTAATAQIVDAYREMLAASHQAMLANGEAPWPDSARCSPSELRMLAEAEVWRVGAAVAFPCKSHLVNPAVMRPITEQLQAATRFALDQLRSPPVVRRPAVPAAGSAPDTRPDAA
jgi:hypothetical protein